MKIKIVIILLSLLSLSSCQSNPEVNFADALLDCLNESDITELNKATAQFEQKLIETYGSKNRNNNYLRYLEDFSQMNLNPNFMLDSNSRDILEDLKTSGTFGKIYISLSEINRNEEDSTSSVINILNPIKEQTKIDIPKIDIITINPNGDYKNCLLNSSIHSSLKELLEFQSSATGLSYNLTSKAISNSLSIKDLDNNLNKVVIATVFYYELVHLANQNL